MRNPGAALRWPLFVVAGLVLLWMLLAGTNWTAKTSRVVELPNGMMFRRAPGWTLSPRFGLFAADGRSLLAPEVELTCFDDRYVKVHAYRRAHSGLYDGETGGRVADSQDPGALLSPKGGCNGYYTAWIGPALLREGAGPPHLPPCGWRNVANPALRNPEWLARPCAGAPQDREP